jgi:tetratricopeptide (TPR) repeat protein
MNKLILCLLLFPSLVFAQSNHLAAKKVFKQAETAFENGNLANATVLFKECLKLDTSYVEAYYNLAQIEYKNKNYNKSIGYGSEAISLKASQSLVYSVVGQSYFMLENYDSSSYFFKRSLLYSEGNAIDYAMYASSENKLKKFEKGMALANIAIDKDDSNANYYIVRGNSYFGIKDFDNAEADYLKAESINSENNDVNKSLANLYIATGNSKFAEEYIKKGIEKSNDSEKLSFLILQGNYYQSIGEFYKAKESFEEAYKLDSQSPIVLTNQSAVLIDLGDYEGAVAKSTEAIDVDPTMYEAYFNRGIANEMLRNTSQACSDWEEAFIMGAVKAEEYLNSPTCNE